MYQKLIYNLKPATMKTPNFTPNIELVNTCVGITQTEWDNFMENTTKANGRQIRLLIKKFLPELYEDLALQYYNPYEHRAVKKRGLLVYVHSGIEYFLQY